MSVDHECRHAFLRFGVQTHDASHPAIGDPHFGAVQLPVVIPELAVVTPKTRDIGKVHFLSVGLVIAMSLGIIRLVVVLIEAERSRIRRPLTLPSPPRGSAPGHRAG